MEALEENDTNETPRALHRHQQRIEIGTKKQSMFQDAPRRRNWIISLSRKRVNRAPASQPRMECCDCRPRMALIRSQMCLVVGAFGIDRVSEVAKKTLTKQKTCRLV
jgi:hypothetical protein